jgi:hypothetical protein
VDWLELAGVRDVTSQNFTHFRPTPKSIQWQGVVNEWSANGLAPYTVHGSATACDREVQEQLPKMLYRTPPPLGRRFGVWIAVLGLTLSAIDYSQAAQSPTTGVPPLELRVLALENLLGAKSEEIADLWAALQAERAARLAAETALASRASTVEAKTQYMTVSATETYFTGTNVHIRNGLGSTNGNPLDSRTTQPALTVVNGLGNLIVGYNAAGGLVDPPKSRDGSHNLVVGDFNYYTSFGGLVAGRDNVVLAPYASVLGGRSNRAAAGFSAVVGGAFNLADGDTSSILGGNANRASNIDATVSGGNGNRATARFSSVSGGTGIIQGVEFGWSAGSLVGPSISGSFSSP